MPVAVIMPRLGESVTEGTVTRWLKQEGDRVDVDEPLLEVSTDKVDTEVPSPAAGVLLRIVVAEDQTVPVGAQLALISDGADDATAPPAASAPPPATAASPATPPPRTSGPTPTPSPAPTAPSAPPAAAPPSGLRSPAAGADPRGAAYASPLVRKLAAEQGVDLATVTGTGGRIHKQDVLEAAARAAATAPVAPNEGSGSLGSGARPAPTAAPAHSPLRGRTEKLSRLRAVIASRMVESLRVAAQLTTVIEVDVTRIAKLRDRIKDDFLRQHGVKLSFLPFFALAVTEALRAHPVLNASLDTAAGTVTYHDAEHLGIAVDTERGLLVPVIRDAGELNLVGMAKHIADVADRTRANRISPDELTGGTLTLTNTGSQGALFDTPILNQPQVGILGTGSVVRRPVVVEDPDLGEITAVRSMVYLSLTYDHRLVDGADAARFLSTLKQRLEAGAFEL